MKQHKCPGTWLLDPTNPKLGPFTHITITNWNRWRWWLEQEFPVQMKPRKSPVEIIQQPTPKLESSFEELNDKDWLIQRYEVEGLTMKEIAQLLDCSLGAVQYAMRMHGIQGRRRGAPRKERPEPSPELVERARRLALRDGYPCGHPGCLSHASHPCEGCGRIGGQPARTP